MTLDSLLAKLGYKGSPHFLRRGDGCFESEPGYGHIFRHAHDKTEDHKNWHVEGVYGLRDVGSEPERFVPIIYVCHAKDEPAAHELHRLVWNQDVVPYILVHEPKGIKVYAGFHYGNEGDNAKRGIFHALTDFDQADAIIRLFESKAVDEGTLWHNPHLQVDPSRRVYHQLLRDLSNLDKWLRNRDGGNLKKEVSHALIGKYVYLRYLRDRDILSDDRLTNLWGIKESEVFGPDATKAALQKLTEKLDDWLNGDIFPVAFTGANAPSSDHVKRVAATFAGHQISEKGWQFHFDFKAYDFSYIPIETLSLIYEQFLHAEDEEEKKDKATKEKTKGRKAGAYYTPIPLVNFMLSELQSRHPLREGMKICDPSCGSGAFLVQAYRRLVEQLYPVHKRRPTPVELRTLLKQSIFGVDLDGDACQVAQLSLSLTLLDYLTPPDLTNYPTFKLPSLKNENIFEGDFFEIESQLKPAAKDGFDWIVGNPPWKQLKEDKLDKKDLRTWEWIQDNAAEMPIGMHQVAQAFSWEAPRYLATNGECALLVPAMGLFEEPSQEFRKNFFQHFQVHTVANFSNLAEVLFDGRSRVPAAALFYRRRVEDSEIDSDEPITTYSPFVVNQEATRPLQSGERRKIWSLVINGSEVRTLDLGNVISGSGLPWKLAMWGTPWDERLIRRLEKKWPSLRTIEDEQLLFAIEGSQLRQSPTEEEDENEIDSDEDFDDQKVRFERIPNLKGKPVLDIKQLKKLRYIFALPKAATVANTKEYVRLQGGKEGLKANQPPHIIVSAARNFAIYTEQFVIVPPRQIGITSPSDDKVLLKAVSLFLSSDFAFYHQFFRSTQFGVQRGRATLESLRQMPIPLTHLSRADLKEWADLHTKLAKCSPRPLHEDEEKPKQEEFFDKSADLKPLVKQLNRMTAEVLELDDREQALVYDLVRVRFELNDGKQGREAIRKPTDPELRAYGQRLKQELDDFIGEDADRLHRVTIVRDDASAMVEVDFTRDHEAARKVNVLPATADEAKKLRETRKKLLQERAQWVYFERNLRVYRGHQTYLFKPAQRFHWTESAAMMDASELIAETLSNSAAPVQLDEKLQAANLSPLEVQVIEISQGNLSLKEIAAQFQLTEQRIQTIQREAERKLKEWKVAKSPEPASTKKAH